MGPLVSAVQHAIANGVGHITLNRPERMNAVTTELARELEHALSELSTDPAVNVIAAHEAQEQRSSIVGGEQRVSRARVRHLTN